MHGRNRVFSFPQTLILCAVLLLHRLHATPNFARRLRVLRNLVEASNNELRLEKRPELLANAQRLIVEGTMDDLTGFNPTQVGDEQLRADLLARCTRLEGALSIQSFAGCIAAFDCDEAVFEQRARTFHELFADQASWPSLMGALLTRGDDSRQLNPRMSQFGPGSTIAPWRALLADAGRSQLAATRDVLGPLLDTMAAADGEPRSALDTIQNNWLDATIDAEVWDGAGTS